MRDIGRRCSRDALVGTKRFSEIVEQAVGSRVLERHEPDCSRGAAFDGGIIAFGNGRIIIDGARGACDSTGRARDSKGIAVAASGSVTGHRCVRGSSRYL